MSHVLEIRSYQLKPDTGQEFHRLFLNEAFAFYGSDEWRQDPRPAILALIEQYAEVVLALDEATIQGLRRILH